MKEVVIDIIKKFLDKSYKRDCVSAYAAQIAYFLIMSVMPFIMLLSALLRYTSVTEDTILYLIEQMTPSVVSGFLITVVDLVFKQPIGLISITAVLAVWSSSKGVHCIVNSLNKINELKETRNWFAVRLRAMFFTFIFLIMTVLLMVLLVFSRSVTELADTYAGAFLSGFIAFAMRRRFLILFLLLIIFFTGIYKFLPNRPRNASVFYQLPGAVFSAISWYVFTFFLAIAVEYMNAFSIYGSMAAVLIIMFWLYVCLTIMLICAEINVYFEKQYSYVFNKLKQRRFVSGVYKRTLKSRKRTREIKKSLKKKLYIKLPDPLERREKEEENAKEAGTDQKES
ncbi:MAG: YihY/virulence factor BrkB family protein [Eubacterium sp.]|nr:YihY/virulence factor BrkB family protein [Eubacterium sp.]